MFACAHCQSSLARMQSAAGIYWACENCRGRTVALPVLRKVVGEEPVRKLWADSREAPSGHKRCPTCRQSMKCCVAGGMEVDVCTLCQFVWFDAHEFEQMPVARTFTPKADPLPQAAREAIALADVKRINEQALDDGPPQTWQNVPAIFGMPVECDTPALTGYPAVTWTIAFFIVAASFAGFYFGDEVFDQFGLIPAEAGRLGGLTFLTAFFLHGGVMHLIGNLYFFLIFGDNVEDYLGRWRYGALLLTASLTGDVAHVLLNPQDTTVCIGASGGISGVITFYALQFPHARLGLFMRHVYYRWVHFPAWSALAIWIVLQLFGMLQQMSGFSNVSYAAHLGGAVAGFIAWLLWRAKERRA